ncbi:MAG: hypothetical protein AAF620_16705 [Bacteroidota bacterium]
MPIFPDTWVAESCGINPPADWADDIPADLVGMIHSHPFYVGEDRRSICGYKGVETAYQGGPSDEDYETLMNIANLTQKFALKSYVVDGSKVSSVDVFRRVSIHKRCGC